MVAGLTLTDWAQLIPAAVIVVGAVIKIAVTILRLGVRVEALETEAKERRERERAH